MRTWSKVLLSATVRNVATLLKEVPASLESSMWLFLAAALSQSVGTHDSQVVRLISYLLIAGSVLVAIARRNGPPHPRDLACGAGMIVVWFTFTWVSSHYLVWLVSLPCALWGLHYLRCAMDVPRRNLEGLVRAILAFSLIYLGWVTVPLFWHYSVGASRSVSQAMIKWALDENVTLGPSISGFWIWILLICHIACEAWMSRRWRRPLVAFGFATTGWLGFMLLINRPWFATQDGAGLAQAQLLGFLVMVLPTVVICGRGKELRGAKTFKLSWKPAVLVLVLFLSSLFLMRSPEFMTDRGKRILVYEKGYLDWKVPEFGRYGAFSGGMFGFMPKYLALEGFEVSTFDDDIITPEALSNHEVLALINLGEEQGKKWRPEEIETIWKYIENGGSLLILGDHTNVFGLQECFNELLERVNVRFEFDSAYPMREGWQNCIISRPHPLTANLPNYRGFGIAIGASLTIAPPSFPVIVGRYSFSDEGYEENVMGSFLGNYAYDKGEPVGDMVLAAACHYGRGKVLVFGDTSMFQNGSWFSGFHPFTHNIVTWLCKKSSIRSNGTLSLALWSAIGLSCLGLFFLMKTHVACFLFPFTLAFGLLMGWIWSGFSMNAPSLAGNLALFDYSHAPRVNTDRAASTGVGGFLTNLDRNGYLTFMMKDFDREALLNSKVYSTIAPVLPYSESEVATLLEFMEQGGFVVSAAGFPEREGILPLLHELGLDISNVPLGPIPLAGAKKSTEPAPKFIDAYPITILSSLPAEERQRAHEATEPLYQYGDFVPAVFREYGEGGFIFFADTRFLSSANIEGMRFGYRLGNILFLKSIFEHVRGEE